MSNISKRVLALLMALVMVLSNVSGIAQTAYAAETVETEPAVVVETEAAVVETTAAVVVETTEAPVVETTEAVVAETTEEVVEATEEVVVETTVAPETEATEEPVVEETEEVEVEETEEIIVDETEIVEEALMAGTLTTSVEGLGAEWTDATVSGTATWTADGTTITGQVVNPQRKNASTSTLTLTNNLPEEAILTFDWEAVTVASAAQISINDEVVAEKLNGATKNGSAEFTLAQGNTVTISVKAAKVTTDGGDTATIKLMNLNLFVDAVIKTTFLPVDAAQGSYTVNGETVTAETFLEQKAAVPYALVATPAEGYVFSGWYSATNDAFISTEATASVLMDTRQSIYPLFLKTEDAVWAVGEACFMELSDAINCAETSNDKVVVLLKDQTLTGNVTVPKGITILIPFDDEHTCYTDTPAVVPLVDPDGDGNPNGPKAWEAPYAFRTLTLAADATLTINGAVSVSAQHSPGNGSGQQYAGAPDGPCGFIQLGSGAKINVENGANLYAWGYIVGSGSVEAKSGATVHENLQITDFRGGTASSQMVAREGDADAYKKIVFPFSQYYVQNIEVPLTLRYGASEKVFTSIYAAEAANSTGMDFVGTDTSMFQIGSGSYITKSYDGANDRLVVTVGGAGEVTVNALTVKLTFGTQNFEISSDMFNLPITNNITINVADGTATMNQNVALLAGTQVNVAQGATLKIGNGFNVYVYDGDEWTAGNFVHNNVKVRPIAYSYANGTSVVRGNGSLADAKVDINGTLSVEGYLYTTQSGANITSSAGTGKIVLWYGNGDATETYQVAQNPDVIFVEIPLTAPQLKNADGTYADTSDVDPDYGAAYTYVDGAWTDTTTVTFDANGGTGTTSAIEIPTIDIMWEVMYDYTYEEELPECTFTREGATFTGWNTKADGTGTTYQPGETYTVTGNATLYAIWNVPSYTVTWVGEDGTTVVATETVKLGESATNIPGVPAKEGHTGAWDNSASNVTADITIKPVYTPNSYDVKWMVDGETYATTTVTYGKAITAPTTNPTKEGHTFDGWDGYTESMTMPAQEQTFNAKWKINTYIITWMFVENVDDEQIGTTFTTEVVYGEKIPQPECTAPAGYEIVSYQRVGETMPAKNLENQITITPATYTVTFNIDGKEYKKVDFTYGATVTTPEYTAPEGYTFSGWNPPATMPANDITLDATLTAETYTASVGVPNWVVSMVNDEYAYVITLTNTNATYGEAFTTELSAVGTGMEIDSVTVNGKAMESYTYEDGILTIAAAYVTGNIEIKAYATVNQTMDVNGGVMSDAYLEMMKNQGAVINGDKITLVVPYGTSTTVPTDFGDQISKSGYSFNGFTIDGKAYAVGDTYVATADATMTFNWEANEYTVTWKIDNVTSTETVAYDTALTAPTAPTKEGYTFTGWTDGTKTYQPGDEIAKVPVDGTTITLTSTWTLNTYTVTFLDKDGNQIGEAQTVEYGNAATAPTAPEVEGYTFTGWDKDFAEVKSDLTVQAKFAENNYTIWYYSIDGEDEYSTVDYSYTKLKEAYPDGNYWDHIESFDDQVPHHLATGFALEPNGETVYAAEGEKIYIPLSDIFSKAVYDENQGAYVLNVYVKFAPKSYTLTWNIDGETKTESVAYGAEIKAPAEPTAEEGYFFLGWSCGEETYAAGDVITTMPGADHEITLTAEWAPKSYNLTYMDGQNEIGGTMREFGAQITFPEAEKTGYTLTWKDANGKEYTTEDTMPASDLTLYAHYTAIKYTVTWVNEAGETVETEEVEYSKDAAKTPEVPEKEGHTGAWDTTATNVTGDVTIKPVYTVNEYTLTIEAVGFENGDLAPTNSPVEIKVPYGAKLADYIPEDCGEAWSKAPIYAVGETVTVDGTAYKGVYTITGWNSWNEEDGYVAIDIASATMPAGEYNITNAFSFTGWEYTDEGTAYMIDNENVLDTVYHVDGEAYLFDEDGYIVAGAGLVRHVTEDGIVEYYYFCDGTTCVNGCTEASYTGFRNTATSEEDTSAAIHWVSKHNDLLPEWDYAFDARGVILHNEDTSLNGLVDEGEDTIYYIDGVPAYMGLIKDENGDYYYVRSSGKLVKNASYWISKTNGLLEEKAYMFDENGKLVPEQLIVKNGIVEENGGLYYYVDGVLTYAGLIQIEGDYYYVRSNGQLVQNQSYWVTKHNDLLDEDSYTFDENGKIVFTPEQDKANGIVDGYYYVDGVKTYAGLIVIDGEYYYINSNCQVITGRSYWITKTNGLLEEGAYTFDETGKIVFDEPEEALNGIVDGYYYVDGVKTYAGLVEIDGKYYYINSSCQVVTGRKYWISKTNGLMEEGAYTFDDTGAMVIG